jgi:endoglucanase Acf2
MIFFKTRAAAREFIKNSKFPRKLIDNGSSAAPGRRWALAMHY